MISNIDPAKSALLSIFGATIGTISERLIAMQIELPLPLDVAIQRLAWTVAIFAGVVSAYNGIVSAVLRYRKNHPKKQEVRK